MLGYLTNRKQRNKIGLAFISWYDESTVVPQGSVPGSLLFNIFINKLFFSEVCNFTDDNALYSLKKSPENVSSNNLKWDLKRVLKWFRINLL